MVGNTQKVHALNEDRVNYSISFNADTPPEIGLVKNLGSINCSDQSAKNMAKLKPEISDQIWHAKIHGKTYLD